MQRIAKFLMHLAHHRLRCSWFAAIPKPLEFLCSMAVPSSHQLRLRVIAVRQGHIAAQHRLLC